VFRRVREANHPQTNPKKCSLYSSRDYLKQGSDHSKLSICAIISRDFFWGGGVDSRPLLAYEADQAICADNGKAREL
jgi:hypothetical protein